jgi:serine/threonine protein kinase
MPATRICPQCGAALPDQGWEGLCPKCIVRVSLETPEPGPERPNHPSYTQPCATPTVPDFVVERTGMMIGRYKLLQQIGEGGFGVVFMAEQMEPVQRKVALKVIKAGMDTREVIARFEAERQALALMDHPNIARVLDAGTTEAQRPFFVMELVRGMPITDYCDENNLSTRDRLELFIKVCRAVQHAHQKGVIHRDLKPGNVLVTLHDGEPVPKVIDFGVAKALGQKLTTKTLFTRFEQMIGTPAYMSPEQAALGGLDLDTRSDIYSLGVLLYELLTGVTPLDAETLRQGILDEIRRMICETDPPKPSTRLLTLGKGLVEVAKRRHAEPAALSRLVRGDLDWITMKALEKDRQRRYETVNGLATDIERHLNHEPVAARAPSTLYRLQKVARRHQVAFTVGAVIAFCLVLGVVTSTWQAIRATRAERLARTQSAENQAVMEILEQTLAGSDPTGERIRQSLLDAATQWLQREHRGDEQKVEDFIRGMQVNMMNFRRAAGQPAVSNLEASFLEASNNAWLAFRQKNYTGAIDQAEQALTIRPQDAAFSQLLADAQTALSKQRAEKLQTLKGLLFVESTNQVEPKGTPGIRGVVVWGPSFLKAKGFENEVAHRLGKPVSELELLRTQKSVVDWCRREGHPLVDVVIPEQDIVDGVLQIAVIDGQLRVLDAELNYLSNVFKPMRSQPSPDGKRIIPASEDQPKAP